MNTQTRFLLVALATLTILIAWAATEPNPYNQLPGVEADPQPYPWTYPAWMVFFGVVVTGLLSFRTPLARFVGAVASFSLSGLLCIGFLASVMHSPPAHGYLLYVFFFSSLGLLFFSGYTFAVWRSKSRVHDSAS